MPSSPPAQVLVIGFGALGSLYALALHKAGAHITAVCRSNYDHVAQHGLRIESDKFGTHVLRPHRVLNAPEQAASQYYDYVLACFKCVPDLEPIGSVLRPYLRNPADFPNEPSRTAAQLPCIVLMQNGVGCEQEPFDTLVRKERVAGSLISAVSWVASNLLEGGTRVKHGSLERLSLGVYPSPLASAGAELHAASSAATRKGSDTLGEGSDVDASSDDAQERQVAQARLDTLVALLRAGGANPEPSPDVQPQRWRKLLWNASWGALSTVARQPIAALLTDASLHYTMSTVRRLMLEVLYVARACGLEEEALPARAVDDALQVTLNMRAVPTSAQESASLKLEAERAVAPPGSLEQDKQEEGKGKEEEGGKEDAKTAAARHTMSDDFKPSLLLDLENGRPMELLPIIGNVIELARIHRVETPRLDLVMAALRPAQVEAIEKARRREGSAAMHKKAAAAARAGAEAGVEVDGPRVEGAPVGSSSR